MKLLVIGAASAVWGFALTGVHGHVVDTAEGLNQALDEALSDASVGIVLVTEDVAGLARDRMDALTVRSEIPLVIEIPGPEGPSEDRPSIRDILRHTIGVRV